MAEPFEILPFDGQSIEGYKFVVRLPVHFRDIDMRGHINNAAYFSYLETVRLEYLIRVMEIERIDNFEQDLPVVMASQTMHYRNPAHYRDILLVGVRNSWIKRSSMGFEFEMRDEPTKRLISDGSYVHVMYNNETGRSMPVFPEWIERFENFEERRLRKE
ncbi:MAG TPA: thioesterase family protein [Chloroflexia bacterium]|nr:thioesterase family protein [Chloroflexia bacterium]